MKESSQRVGWIDSARGWGILMVIYAHIENWSKISAGFYCFHIPLLFFISGYLFNGEDLKPIDFLKKKIRSIALPCMALSIPVVIFQIAIADNQWDMLKILFPQIFLQIRTWTLWYMACLFVLNIMLYTTVKNVGIRVDRIIFVALCWLVFGGIYLHYIGVKLVWNIDVAFMAFAFFAGGYITRITRLIEIANEKIANLINIKVMRDFFYIILIGASVFLGWLSKMVYNETYYALDMYGNIYNFIPLTMLSAFLGITAIVLLCNNHTFRAASIVGKHSVTYFAWHFSIYIPLFDSFCNNININLNIRARTVLLFAFIVAASELSYYLISKCRISWVFGIKSKWQARGGVL